MRGLLIGTGMQGINAAHEEFLSADGTALRILTGFSLDGLTPESDCNGHGTHISGTAAGRYFGVAKNAFIHPCAHPLSPVPSEDHFFIACTHAAVSAAGAGRNM